ncbi:MAG: hypothetical protein QOI74_3483 [Micromonosporaceae bacterium]|jgi:hypothetical protein|nr:hypothetical protein [Micromonosporaceae bacterium]
MVVGTLPPVWLVLSPEDGPSRIVSPLRGLHESLSGGPLSAGVQVVGNLLVFAAFGLLGPVRWRIGVREVVAVAAAASVVLETSQYVFDLGRFSDLGDVVLNAGGAGLVALCGRPWWRRTGTDVEAAPRSGGRAARRSGGGAARRSGGGAVGRQLGGDPTSVPPHRYGEHST